MDIFHPISSKIGSKEARHNGDRKALLDCHVFCEIKNGPNFVAINLAKKWHGCYCLQLGCLYSLLHSAVDNLAFLTKVRLLKMRLVHMTHLNAWSLAFLEGKYFLSHFCKKTFFHILIYLKFPTFSKQANGVPGKCCVSTKYITALSIWTLHY